ncbi:MAG TPA: hypothetical protein VK694_05645 [Verrucomicrobiae bacterium]|nr:hypothetical protein [Verrucomicrobiae bacterium]
MAAEGLTVEQGVLRDPNMADAEHTRRVATLSGYPSMQQRIAAASMDKVDTVPVDEVTDIPDLARRMAIASTVTVDHVL